MSNVIVSVNSVPYQPVVATSMEGRNMRPTYSQKTLKFADHLVSMYSKYDHISQSYILSTNSIPDFDLHEFCSYMFADNYDRAVESLGPDNNSYNKQILPALIKFLSDSTEKDNEIDLIEAIKNGITNYNENEIQEILEERLSIYNQNHRSPKNESSYVGALSW